MENLMMRSCLHENGTIENALVFEPVRDPAPNEVVIKVEAAPINPSDLGLMVGWGDKQAARQGERNGYPSLLIDLPPAAAQAMSNRLGQWLEVGNEGSGTVVAAGSDPAAQAMIGKRVGVFGGGLFAKYRVAPITACLPVPEGTTADQAASCFVNPMTALSMVETMKMEGHTAIIHTAAASNLGQMLNRICLADGIELVNIVRKAEQVELLKAQGAKYVVNSSDPDFQAQLAAAVEATGATIAFDAIGGGDLNAKILMAMEASEVKKMTTYSRYGSTTHKQVYIYGALDVGPTVMNRGFGFAWSVSGWLLTNFLAKAGLERMMAMQKRIATELTTTFASNYSDETTLASILDKDTFLRYSKFATGQKTLLRIED